MAGPVTKDPVIPPVESTATGPVANSKMLASQPAITKIPMMKMCLLPLCVQVASKILKKTKKPSQAEADSLSCEVDCFDHRQDNSPETELTRRSLGGLNLHVYLVNQAQLAVILASCLKVSIPVW